MNEVRTTEVYDAGQPERRVRGSGQLPGPVRVAVEPVEQAHLDRSRPGATHRVCRGTRPELG